ncbi:MAG: cobalt ECF transporter T component CbiQ [Lachnospiraceae bacterium]|nr:cobalt ECF transporter T component CbiQ [Lachnospiraceae bacterium]
MDQISAAMHDIAEIDTLAAGNSFLHRRHPLPKLLITILYIFTVVSFPTEQLSGILPMILVPVVLYQLADIPVSTCFYKLRFILPLVCAVGIWNPILNRTPALQMGRFVVTAGMISFVTLLLKGILSLMMSFLLIAVTSIEKICYALRLLHVPKILVTQTLITFRYISLLLHEAGTMFQAYQLRAPGQKGVHISAWGSFLGQLLLRSMDRAGELYQSMELRGFRGSFYYADVKHAGKADYMYFIVMAAVLLLFRSVNISILIGTIFS